METSIESRIGNGRKSATIILPGIIWEATIGIHSSTGHKQSASQSKSILSANDALLVVSSRYSIGGSEKYRYFLGSPYCKNYQLFEVQYSLFGGNCQLTSAKMRSLVFSLKLMKRIKRHNFSPYTPEPSASFMIDSLTSPRNPIEQFV